MTIVKVWPDAFSPTPVWTSNSDATQSTLRSRTPRHNAQVLPPSATGVTTATLVGSDALMPLTPTQKVSAVTWMAYATPLLCQTWQEETGDPHHPPPTTA